MHQIWRNSRCGVFAVALGALPAAAQDRHGDLSGPGALFDMVRTCVASAPDPAARRACIGRSVSPCMSATPEGQTTLGIVACNLAEAEAWADLMERELARARLFASELDRLEARAANGWPEAAPALERAQSTWEAYRDAQCGWEYAKFGGGSMRTIMGAACRLEMTAERALALYAIGREV